MTALDEVRKLAASVAAGDRDTVGEATTHFDRHRLARFAIAALDEMTAWRMSGDREMEAAGHDLLQAIATKLERP